MPEGDIVVNFAMLRAAAEDIRSTVGTMNSTLDSLKQGLQPLVSTWEGEAQTAYYARQSQWDTAATDLNTLLGQIQTAVNSSADIMQAREQSNMSRF